jgi:hypothetical protein
MSTRAAVRENFIGLLFHRQWSRACDGKHTVSPDRRSIRCISGRYPFLSTKIYEGHANLSHETWVVANPDNVDWRAFNNQGVNRKGVRT